jgi:hypothetical protein
MKRTIGCILIAVFRDDNRHPLIVVGQLQVDTTNRVDDSLPVILIIINAETVTDINIICRQIRQCFKDETEVRHNALLVSIVRDTSTIGQILEDIRPRQTGITPVVYHRCNGFKGNVTKVIPLYGIC